MKNVFKETNFLEINSNLFTNFYEFIRHVFWLKIKHFTRLHFFRRHSLKGECTRIVSLLFQKARATQRAVRAAPAAGGTDEDPGAPSNKIERRSGPVDRRDRTWIATVRSVGIETCSVWGVV